MKTDVIDSSIPLATRVPLRLRVVQPRGDGVLNAGQLMGVGLLRIAFGAIWAVDAALKWQPAFEANFARG